MSVALAAGLAGVCLMAAPAQAQDASSPAIGFDQARLGTAVPLDLEFRDESGAAVTLGNLTGGKPTILALVQYECPMLCTLVLNGLVDGLNELGETPGDEFMVLTVSFDAREGPELALRKKAAYLENLDQRGAESGWRFLTGSAESMGTLTEALGYRYRYDAAKGQFAHPSGLTILTPDGRIARFLVGIRYTGKELAESLQRAEAGEIDAPRTGVSELLCDPPPLGSAADVRSNWVRLAVVGGVAAMLAVLAVSWVRGRKGGVSSPHRREAGNEGQPRRGDRG